MILSSEVIRAELVNKNFPTKFWLCSDFRPTTDWYELAHLISSKLIDWEYFVKGWRSHFTFCVFLLPFLCSVPINTDCFDNLYLLITSLHISPIIKRIKLQLKIFLVQFVDSVLASLPQQNKKTYKTCFLCNVQQKHNRNHDEKGY